MRWQTGTNKSNRIDRSGNMPSAQSHFAFTGLVIGFRLREFGRISAAC